MSAELLRLLFETALAGAAALLAVLAMRHAVRRGLGARAAYALWLLVPAAMIAVLLPAPRAELAELAALPAAQAQVGAPVPLMHADADATSVWLIAAWSLGALLSAAMLARRQRAFRRQLGALRPRADGSWCSQSDRIGPAVIGVWCSRVVVPCDFDARYSAAERDLVLCHERMHVARRDLAVNLLASALRCLHWFNPLLHYAIGRFRFDQELAADALVLARHPHARREYADAMLKTQLLADPPPLGCHWQSAHPLKERILMLKQPLPGAARAVFGTAFAAVLALASGYAAWAAQPAQDDPAAQGFADGDELLHVVLRRDGIVQTQRWVRAEVGHPAPIESGDLMIDYRITQLDADMMEVSAMLSENGAVVSSPRVRFKHGTAATIAHNEHESPAWSAEDPNPPKIGLELRYDTLAALRGKSPDNEVTRDVSYARLQPPEYPKDAVAARSAGTVVLRVLVGTQGAPEQVEVDRSSGDVRLDDAAVAKVRDWRFNPAQAGEEKIAQWVRVPVTFSLDGPPAQDERLQQAPGALDEIYIAAPQG